MTVKGTNRKLPYIIKILQNFYAFSLGLYCSLFTSCACEKWCYITALLVIYSRLFLWNCTNSRCYQSRLMSLQISSGERFEEENELGVVRNTNTDAQSERHACCLHQDLGRRTWELKASKIVSSRNRLDMNRYQLI